MKGSLIICLIVGMLICGCKSINVGGTGKVGTVSGGGQIHIPIPKAK